MVCLFCATQPRFIGAVKFLAPIQLAITIHAKNSVRAIKPLKVKRYKHSIITDLYRYLTKISSN